MGIIIFYVILSITICIISSVSLYVLGRIIKILDISQQNELIDAKINYAKKFIKIGYMVQLCLFFFSICTMLMCIEMLTDFLHLSFNHGIILLVTHSVLEIGLCIILMLRSYRADICCRNEHESIWMIYGCHCTCWPQFESDVIISSREDEYLYQLKYDSTETFNYCNLPSSHPTPTTVNSSI